MRQIRILLCVTFWMLGVGALAIPISEDVSIVWKLGYLVALPVVMGVLLVNRKIGTIAPLLVFPAMLFVAGLLTAMDARLLIFQVFSSTGMAWGAAFLAAFAGLVCGWLYLALLARQYGRGRLSELLLQNDVLWLLISATHTIPHLSSHGWFALSMFIPFVVYRLVLYLFAKVFEPKGSGSRLLFLRVFGFQKRQAELHRVFLNAWRRVGTVAMIGAPDAALDTIDPPELFAFVTGRLKRLFVSDPEAVKVDLAKPQARTIDGLFKLDDLYCFADTWQSTVQALIKASSVVVMDLRDFDSQNMGCIYEIGELFELAPVERLVFMVDDTTDKAVLEACMQQAWATSPRQGQQATVVLWEIADTKALRRLFRQLRAQINRRRTEEEHDATL